MILARLTAASASRAIAANFPNSRFLGPQAATALRAGIERSGIAGGTVHDALVGMTAREHAITLCTRDQRASKTYRARNVPFDPLVAAPRA